VSGDKATGIKDESLWDRHGIADAKRLSPIEQLLTEELRHRVNQAMNKIHKQHRDIVCYRLVITDGKRKTLHQTGKRFKLILERVRQIEAESLQKINNDLKAIYLDYCTNSEAQWTKPN